MHTVIYYRDHNAEPLLHKLSDIFIFIRVAGIFYN